MAFGYKGGWGVILSSFYWDILFWGKRVWDVEKLGHGFMDGLFKKQTRRKKFPRHQQIIQRFLDVIALL